MKKMLGSRKHHYTRGVVAFWVTVALIAGMLGCAAEIEPAAVQYNLTISSTEGGSVTTPREGTFTYDAGMVIDLVAEPEEGYWFTKWTGNVGTIADVNAASTTITMNGACFITANFAKEIRDWHDLDAIRYNLSGSYVLMNDLDSTTAGYVELASNTANDKGGWQPVGSGICLDPIQTNNPYIPTQPFLGTFDGLGYEIRDLLINRPDEDVVGLFGFVGEQAIIQNLRVIDGDVTGRANVGIVAGANIGTIRQCYSSGSVIGDNRVGGLAGYNHGSLIYTSCSGIVAGSQCVGGVVGVNNWGNVGSSYYVGSVAGEGAVGGLVGWNDHGTVANSHYNYDEVLINGENVITIGALFGTDLQEWLANGRTLDIDRRLSREDGCYLITDVNDLRQLLIFGQRRSLRFRLTNDLDLVTEPGFYVPYLAGDLDGNGHRIMNLNCGSRFIDHVGMFGYLASSGRVNALGVEAVRIVGRSDVGGLVGRSYGVVSNAYSTGSVIGGGMVGGLVGRNTGAGTVINSYSMSNVTGGSRVGGLVGWNEGTATNSYSAGRVTGSDDVGGLVGRSYRGRTSNSFWDTEASGQANPAGGIGKKTSEMKEIATFRGAAWSIAGVGNAGARNPAYIWNIVDGQTYPFLSWQSVS